MAKKWMGAVPEMCQCGNCRLPLKEQFVDGRDPRTGMWGIFTVTCFKRMGGTYGTGRGQRYDAKTLEKVEG
jgi:hypothetical protein